MAATIRDVARLAGVSTSTVSRALSVPDLVNPATRAKVRSAADSLDYAPNKAARGLITGRTGNLGLVLPDLANPFFPSVVKGVQARARAADLAVFVADTDEDVAAETGLVRALAQQVDGLVLCSPRAGADELAKIAADTTVVLLNRLVDDLPAVVFDHADGMRQAVAHLVALGHRRIAWVSGPAASWSSEQRGQGLAQAAADQGVELVEVGHFPPHYDGGMAAADQVVATGATAVITYNDLVAIGLLARLHGRGIAVPDELSVVGIDDIAMAAMARPALTTIRLPKERAGRLAVELLLTLLDHATAADEPPVRRVLRGDLMVRASTGVPPR
ncbi:transcriptional regulator, LacI family [Kribbella flavida DSM 17836]|uniref:Transcriptional regulator, LacI family n=1 Tax=Kribbella flavida (strain DSM 17836 / JCM 10339 / NBRC 14399) TaxID=479435 RepID=D2PZ26_KRIFD|nr:LacI family DNA-binding transcriptional regulator [Kribbella flavida]ADB31820.1 transcriptional regulator, LacI family [Kribbella flavida DSM 17836]